MRGGRNKFGPMYKRDRARKLQMIRQRQLALQTLRSSLGEPSVYATSPSSFLHIKQEIQIPQISSLTSSPDSSPSPGIAAANSQSGMSATLTCNNSHPNHVASNSLNNSQTSHTILTSCELTQQALDTPHLSHSAIEEKLWSSSSTSSSTTSSLKVQSFGYATGISQPSHSSHNTEDVQNKTNPIIRDFVQTIDDREWQTSLFGLLQSQTYNQCEVDLFELMCKVLDQNLFSQVDWARNSVFFKDLKVILDFLTV